MSSPEQLYNDITIPPSGTEYTYELKFWNIFMVSKYQLGETGNLTSFEQAMTDFRALYDEDPDKFSDLPEQYLSSLWQGRFRELSMGEKVFIEDLPLDLITIQTFIQERYLIQANLNLTYQLEQYHEALTHLAKIVNKLGQIEHLFQRKSQPQASDIMFDNSTDYTIADYEYATDDQLAELSTLTDNEKIKLQNYIDDLRTMQADLSASRGIDSNDLHNSAKTNLVDILDDVFDTLDSFPPTTADTALGVNYEFDKWIFDTTAANKLMASSLAAQHTNEVTKNYIGKSLFVLEEFYKSAATTISLVHALIRTMGQNIDRT